MLGGGNNHQISLSGGVSTRSNGFENLYSAMVQYSEPSDFFFLRARTNLEVGGMLGEKNKGNSMDCSANSGSLPCDDYNQYILGVSKDAALLSISKFYLGVGLGAYIKTKSRDDERVNSAFTFGEKALLGYSFGPANAEVFIRHFSNGSLTEKNSGYNFVGAAIAYNF